jgi:hypothetical protein
VEHLIGYIIIALSLLSVGIVAFVAHRQYKAAVPQTWIQHVGVTYSQGAKEWPGLEEAIAAVWSTMLDEFPDKAAKIMDVWIDVVPPDGKLQGYSLTGPPPPPLSQWNGTVDRRRWMFKTVYIVRVRQALNRAGELRPARASALFHEFAEHRAPHVVAGSLNSAHDPKWEVLRGKISDKFKATAALKA